MLVRKQVFNFKLLDSVDSAKMDCCSHFFNLIYNTICILGDTRNISDRERILERSQLISFDTNSIKLEFSVGREDILWSNVDKAKEYDVTQQRICSENKTEQITFKNHIANVLEYTSPEGKTDVEFKEDTWSYKIFVKIIQLSEKCYYFYTI